MKFTPFSFYYRIIKSRKILVNIGKIYKKAGLKQKSIPLDQKAVCIIRINYKEKNGFKSITLNEDKSATYVMTKHQHKKMMKTIAADIRTGLAKMVGSSDYPNITNAEANSDFTKFTITTPSNRLDFTESVSILSFYMYSEMYAAFNGTEIGNIHVDFINADTGALITSADSMDMSSTETE